MQKTLVTPLSSTTEKVNTAIDEKKAAAENARKERFDTAILPLAGTEAETFIYALGDSPVKLTDGKVKQIKETFPVPREQNILWADAEFDLRPSGIVVTDKGVFIRTNVSMLDGKIGVSNFALDDLEGDEQQAYLQHQYLLDEVEIDCLISRLNEIKQKEFKTLFESLEKSSEQECVVREFLNPHFEAVVAERTRFLLPTPECVIEAMAELIEDGAEEQTDAR